MEQIKVKVIKTGEEGIVHGALPLFPECNYSVGFGTDWKNRAKFRVQYFKGKQLEVVNKNK